MNLVAFDIETSGLDPVSERWLSLAWTDGSQTTLWESGFERFLPILEDPQIVKIAHNASFDLRWFLTYYPCRPQNIWDTMLMEKLLHAGILFPDDLQTIVAKRCGIMIEKETRNLFIGHEGPLTESMRSYARQDVEHLIPLYHVQRDAINKAALGRIAALENRVVLSVADMEKTGMGFDLNGWSEIECYVENQVQTYEYRLREYLGGTFIAQVPATTGGVDYIKEIAVDQINFGSAAQVRAIFNQLGHPLESTAKGVLDTYCRQHDAPFIDLYRVYKEWNTRRRWRWHEYVHPLTRRIHPDWKQLGTDTGRFSSKNPNAQNIPRGDDPAYRALFGALPNHTLICADWSQQEPRILAHMSADTRLVEAAQEKDIYSAMGRFVYGKALQKSDPRRHQMKIGVLATLYGAGSTTVAEQLSISARQAEQFQNTVFKAFPVARRWGDGQYREAKQLGYTKTVWGRRRYYSDGLSAYRLRQEARNAPVQGTGADMLKLAMADIQDYIYHNRLEAHFVWVLHDEVGISVRKDQAGHLLKSVLQLMEHAGTVMCPSVPFSVDGDITDLWMH